MTQRTVPCRVCGKPFVPCGKTSVEIGAFNYREVACSPKCGQEYLKRVLDERKPKQTMQTTKKEIDTLQDELSDDTRTYEEEVFVYSPKPAKKKKTDK